MESRLDPNFHDRILAGVGERGARWNGNNLSRLSRAPRWKKVGRGWTRVFPLLLPSNFRLSPLSPSSRRRTRNEETFCLGWKGLPPSLVSIKTDR